MKELLLELHQYNIWANDRLAKALANLNQPLPERTQLLFSHILNAQCIWYSRLTYQESPYKVFQVHDLPQLISMADNTSKLLCRWLEKLPEEKLADTYTYTNTQGKTYTNSVLQILTHVVNHATYHRGQIATDMRLHGLEPLMTDYIAYARELNGEL